MRWTPLLALIAVAGCDDSIEVSEYAASTVTPASVSTDEERDGLRRDWTGTISMSGDPGDYVLTADTTAGRIEIEIRNTTDTDILPALDKVEATQIGISENGLTGDLSLGVRDAQGPVYLLETVLPSALSDDLFPNLVREGNEVGVTTSNNTDIALQSAILTTDDGVTEVFPGVPTEIQVQGIRYQFVLMYNWQRTIPDGIGVECSLMDVLGYEVVRLAEGDTVDTTPLARNPGSPIDGNSCQLSR